MKVQLLTYSINGQKQREVVILTLQMQFVTIYYKTFQSELTTEKKVGVLVVLPLGLEVDLEAAEEAEGVEEEEEEEVGLAILDRMDTIMKK
jgi:hypothetical protein